MQPPSSPTSPSQSPASPQPKWYARSGAEAAGDLGVDLLRGLPETEAARRLAADGPNSLVEAAGPGTWTLFLSQFKSLVILMLIVAGLLSGALGEWVDAIVILAIVLINGVIGFFQEYNAGQSIAALRKMTAPVAKVRRDGKLRNLPSSRLVRGDIVEFESGDLVPADVRLLDVSALKCMEAALTGESDAVEKNAGTLPAAALSLGDRINMAYMGTSISSGEGKAIVVATGAATEIGRIATLLDSAETDSETPLQKRMDALSRTLVWVCVGLVIVLFLLGLWRGRDAFEQFMMAVSLAVAAAPEGLPAVVTVSLALGVQRMARRKALVRRLPSVETMGSATVICTDKTGTLTAGEMTVREFHIDGETFSISGGALEPLGSVQRNGSDPDPAQFRNLRLLASVQAGTSTASLYEEGGEWKVAGDPTEGALIAAGRKLGYLPADSGAVGEADAERRVHAFPFDSDRKRASSILDSGKGGFRIVVNGAPDQLMVLCTQVHSGTGARPFRPGEREEILAVNAAMAAKGLRVIGSAYKESADPLAIKPAVEDVEKDLVFAGLAGMQDPPRPEARVAVAKCRAAGIRVVMITGDHPATASAIALDLGIADAGAETVTGLRLDEMGDEELTSLVDRIAVYARVSAAHKLRIVRALKAKGAVVAMTGDGVNDAPALKGADIGVAMGRTGTEVTKQASDMVIADDNFATIVAAVEEGRGIFQNIRNTLQFLLAGNAGELLLMTAAIVVGLPSPLLPIHLLWINLVTDGLPALCLASEPIDPDVMKRKPRDQSEIMSDRSFLIPLILTGLLTAGVTLAVFLWMLPAQGLDAARSAAFTTLVLAELFRSLGARSEIKPFWKMGWRGNPRLYILIGGSVLLQFFLHQNQAMGGMLKIEPMSLETGLVVAALALAPLLVLEAIKGIKAAAKR